MPNWKDMDNEMRDVNSEHTLLVQVSFTSNGKLGTNISMYDDDEVVEKCSKEYLH